MLNWELLVNNAENALHASNLHVVKYVMLFNHFLQNVWFKIHVLSGAQVPQLTNKPKKIIRLS